MSRQYHPTFYLKLKLTEKQLYSFLLKFILKEKTNIKNMHFLTLILKVQSWTKSPPRDSTIRSNHSFKFSTNKFHFLSNLFKNIPFLYLSQTRILPPSLIYFLALLIILNHPPELIRQIIYYRGVKYWGPFLYIFSSHLPPPELTLWRHTFRGLLALKIFPRQHGSRFRCWKN